MQYLSQLRAELHFNRRNSQAIYPAPTTLCLVKAMDANEPTHHEVITGAEYVQVNGPLRPGNGAAL
ncbi:hypothetical protein ACFW5I_36575 [Streptomyces sp. NPDC058818]|uniref:hypothetical protein n=1 Tax=Streptomyces sp. NPDC058818 TaxID=3346640 RepID=UPI0036BA7F75